MFFTVFQSFQRPHPMLLLQVLPQKTHNTLGLKNIRQPRLSLLTHPLGVEHRGWYAYGPCHYSEHDRVNSDVTPAQCTRRHVNWVTLQYQARRNTVYQVKHTLNNTVRIQRRSILSSMSKLSAMIHMWTSSSVSDMTAQLMLDMPWTLSLKCVIEISMDSHALQVCVANKTRVNVPTPSNYVLPILCTPTRL